LPEGTAAAVCQLLLEPPAPDSVKKSVEQLVQLGAIEVEPKTRRESLTALGKHLANLPLEARLGKLVLLGTAFGPAPTDAALTLAASLQSRNPFVSPLDKREEANKMRLSFAEKVVSKSVGLSDHLGVLRAYQEWDKLSPFGDERFDFCQTNFLSIKTLQGMADLKRQLLEILSEAGFVVAGLKAKRVGREGRNSDGSDGVLLALAGGATTEPCPPELLAALLCQALFPQIVKATAPIVQNAPKPKKGKVPNGQSQPKPKLTVQDAVSGLPVPVKMHPSCVAAQETTFTSPYLVYQELVNTTRLYVRDVTPVPPLALILFCGSQAAAKAKLGDQRQHGSVVLKVDEWISLSVPASVQALLLEARRRLDSLLTSFVAGPQKKGQALCNAGGQDLLNGIVQLLSIQEECALPAAEQKAGGTKRAASNPPGGGGKRWKQW